MLTKPIAVVGLAVGVIVAAGTGTYLGVRQNAQGPPQVVEADAEGASNPLTTATAAQTALGTAVEATEAVVGTIAPIGAENGQPVSPDVDAPRQQPVAAPAPTPRSRPAPADQVSAPTSSTPAQATSAPAAAPVEEPIAEAAPADRPVEAARADLPAIEGWTRPEVTAPSPDTAPEPLDTSSTVTDLGSIAGPESESPVAPVAPVAPETLLVELEIAADSVIGLQVDTAVSTRTAEIEDTVEARVTRNVLVADEVAVPAGTRILGSVVLVEQIGKLRGAARLGVRFHTLVMDDGLQVPIATETIYREGKARGSDSVSKIGGAAVGGAILGAIFGGSRGAAIGGSIGAAGGTAAALNSDGDPAGLPPGTMLTVRLSRPVMIAVEQ
jgi:hypothetical protein